jgi:Mg2+ and Co2+ transporter CorA
MRYESLGLLATLIRTLNDDAEAIEAHALENTTSDPAIVPILYGLEKKFIELREETVKARNAIEELEK